MLADPNDAAVRAQVGALLDKLASEPVNGIDRILDGAELARQGGFPGAAYLVALRIGYEVSYGLSMPLIAAPSNLGMHGFLPDTPEMRSSFFMVGPRAAKGRSLGEIDMRQIAPTLADVLGVRLSGAEMAALPLN